MEDLRYESSASREKYGEFHTEKRVNYIGYFQKDQFIVEELKKNISMSK